MKTVRNDSGRKKNTFLLGFSPWLLAVACTLLLVLLAMFTVSNYQREKELIGEALVQKGLTLMRFINSATREAIRGDIRSSRPWLGWEEQVRAAMEQAVEQPGVERVLLLDASGNILAAAGAELPGSRLDEDTLSFVGGLQPGERRAFVSRIRKEGGKEGAGKKFQIASWYLPPGMGPHMMDFLERRPGRGQMTRMFSHHPELARIQEEMNKLVDLHPLFLVQLDVEQFDTPLRRQLLQIVILSAVILLVGLGGSLAYMTLKGLRGSQQRLGTMRAFNDILISALPIGLIATDGSGSIQVCNEAAAAMLGVEEKNLLGRLPLAALPQGLARMFSASSSDITMQRQGEVTLDSGAEKTSVLQLASVIVRDEVGEFAGEVLLMRDLTEVKQLEKDLQRSERLAALGKMAAGVAHELRNPLSSIKGLAVLLRSQVSGQGREAEAADVLVKEVERLNRSIGELLDYARPGKLSRKPASIAGILEKTVSLVRMDAEAYGIAIHPVLPQDLPEIPVDSDKLKQVFLNLLLNGVQAMPDGGTLGIRLIREGDHLVTVISDTGVGIAPENLPRVFDPYYTTKNDGTGLGLAMSAKIVEEHGGRIMISSAVGESTEVRVILPMV